MQQRATGRNQTRVAAVRTGPQWQALCLMHQPDALLLLQFKNTNTYHFINIQTDNLAIHHLSSKYTVIFSTHTTQGARPSLDDASACC